MNFKRLFSIMLTFLFACSAVCAQNADVEATADGASEGVQVLSDGDYAEDVEVMSDAECDPAEEALENEYGSEASLMSDGWQTVNIGSHISECSKYVYNSFDEDDIPDEDMSFVGVYTYGLGFGLPEYGIEGLSGDIKLEDTFGGEFFGDGEIIYALCIGGASDKITGLWIPDGVKYVELTGSWVGLEKLVLPESLKYLWLDFEDSSSLKKITIPQNVYKVMLGNTCNLEEIDVSSENPYYTSKDGVLCNKDKTALVKYPPAKEGTSYVVPDSVVKLHEAFLFCRNLKSITIPASVKYISTYQFEGCDNLENIIVNPENLYLRSKGGVVFDSDGILICYPVGRKNTVYTVPTGISGIETEAFINDYLEKVIISNGVEWIADYAFCCPLLKHVVIPASVTDIGRRIVYSYDFDYESVNIYYAGNEDEWYEIGGNDLYTMHYNYVLPDVTVGDVNGDGEVNARDERDLARHFAEWSGYEDIDMAASDVNGDGEVNARDERDLARHLAEWSGYEVLPVVK